MTAQIPQPRPQLPKAIPEEVREIVNNWAGIVSQATPPLKVYLKNARLSLGGDNNLMIVVEDGLPYDYLKEPDNKSRVEDMIASFLQKEVTVHIEKMQEGRSFEESYVDLSKLTDMDIEVVEEYKLLNGWSYDKKRGSVRYDRIPVGIRKVIELDCPQDYMQFVPEGLENGFTSADFANAAHIDRQTAASVLAMLNYMEQVKRVGKTGNAYIYDIEEHY